METNTGRKRRVGAAGGQKRLEILLGCGENSSANDGIQFSLHGFIFGALYTN